MCTKKKMGTVYQYANLKTAIEAKTELVPEWEREAAATNEACYTDKKRNIILRIVDRLRGINRYEVTDESQKEIDKRLKMIKERRGW